MDGVLVELPGSCEPEVDLAALVVQLRQEVAQLRVEVARLRRENLELRQQAGYWQGMHAKALKRIAVLEQEHEHLRAKNRKLQDQLFGRKAEQKPVPDRSNDLQDPEQAASAKRRRGQQPDRSGPGRGDDTHLPAREEVHDLPEGACVCPRWRLPLLAKGDTEDSTQIEIEVRA